VVVFQSIEI
jgi:hypothetical protein